MYPGLHLRELIRKLNMSEGTIRYHLKYLKKRELITEDFETGYSRFFINNTIGRIDKKLISILRKKTCRYIILFLMFGQAASRKKLSKELGEKPKIVEYYLKKLKKAGIIKQAPVINGLVKIDRVPIQFAEYHGDSKEIVYILDDYDLLNDFFIVKQKWFYDLITIDLIKHSIALEEYVPPKKINAVDTRVDNIIDLFFEMCPHPYHA
jgi:DNA-binding transcriptional ArsR family regulator